MQKVKIVRGTVIHGVGAVEPGTIHEVDNSTANAMFIVGRAVPVEDEPEKPITRKPKKATKK